MLTSWPPGVCELDGEAIFIELWEICGDQTGEARPRRVNNMAYYLMPNLDRTRRFTIRKTDSWLDRGLRLTELTELCATARKLNLR